MPQSAEDVAKRSGRTLGPTTRDRQQASEERNAKAADAAHQALKALGKKSRKRGSK